MPPRLRIGLTGGIASGKSTVASRFVELAVPVIDADESARRVVAPGTSGLSAVTAAFGQSVLTASGELDRGALRGIVFAEAARRRTLEGILHPLIRADMECRASVATGPYVVLAIPLLVESGDLGRVDRVLVVDTDPAMQLERLLARDGGSATEARAMIAAQASRSDRLAVADDVIENSAGLDDVRAAVDSLHRRYLVLAAAR